MAGSRNKKTYHFGAGHVGPTPALITFPPQLVVFWRDVPFALSWCGQVVAVVVEIVVGGDGWPMKGVVDIHTYLYGSSVRSGPNRGSASADFCLNREQNRTELSVRSDRFRFSGSVRNRTSATLLLRAQACEISSPGPQPCKAQARLKPRLRPRLWSVRFSGLGNGMADK
jgi:hypothetical protein